MPQRPQTGTHLYALACRVGCAHVPNLNACQGGQEVTIMSLMFELFVVD
jgi:hypothetical protein